MKALETGLVTLFGDATLAALIGSRVWRDPAPEGEAHPLLVFRVSLRTAHTFGDDNGYRRADVFVKVIDDSEDQTNADAAFARVGELLMGDALAVTGYTVMGATRGEEVSYPEHDGDRLYQHVGGHFDVLLQKD